MADNGLPKRYTSASLVARGGMGEVYRATDSVLDRRVAVKLLAGRHTREPEVRARFRREALAAARLSGTPHVITVFDVGEHDDQPYIVMEYLEGGSVYDRLREGRATHAQALEWLAQAGIALDRAHAQGVVHRDVKPANLMLDRDGRVVVTDFGIASTTGQDTLTLPGTVLGTAGYLSPEQARGEPATAASDRYGLGVVAFELLTGRRPFQADTAVTEAFAHVNARVPSAQELDPDLPGGIDDVLGRALAKDPADRPRSCGELVVDLRRAFRDSEAPTRSIPPVVPAAGSSARAPASRASYRSRLPRRSFALAVVGVLVAGAVLAAVLAAVTTDGNLETAERTAPTTETQPTTTETQPTTTETQPTTTETQPTTTEDQPTTTEPEQTEPAPDGVSLNDRGFALMQDGEYAQALPLLEDAVRALRGTGSLTEAYASYNLAFTRFALGSCAGVVPLLDRSEQVQGQRDPIDSLRREWEASCGDGGEADEDRKGKGKGKGRANGDGD